MKRCACGCGQFTKEGNRFIYEHNSRGKYNSMWGKVGFWANKKRPNISGKNHPMFGKENKWGHHTKETRKKWSKARKGKNNPMWGIHRYGKNSPMWGKENKWGCHSKKTKKQQSIKRIDWIKKHPEWREQAAKRCIEMNMKGFKPSKFEKRIIQLIKQNHLPWKYIGDGREGSFFGKVPDFINTNGQKAFAEAYEDRYWKDKSYVPKRRRFFAKFGFKTIFIHYDDNDNEIIKKLMG